MFTLEDGESQALFADARLETALQNERDREMDGERMDDEAVVLFERAVETTALENAWGYGPWR